MTYTHEDCLRVIRGVALCILLGALDQVIIVPAIPRMARELGGGSAIGWTVAAYLLTGTAATPIFGRLSDMYGRKRLLQPALALFVGFSLVCAVAPSFWVLVLGRAGQGIGGAGLITIAQTAISDVASPRERGRYQIYMSGVWGIASLGGPVLGGFLTDAVSWRWIFGINLPLGALAWVLSARALAILPVPEGRGSKIDFLGAAVLTGAVTSWLLLCVPEAGAWRYEVAAGCVFLLLVVLVERRAAQPMLPLQLFANGTVLGGFLLSVTNSLCTFGASFLLPLYFQYVRHMDAAESGLLTTPFLLSFVVLSYVGGRISRAMGRTKPAMILALSCCAAGLLGLASLRADTALWVPELAMVVLGAGIGLVQPNITVAIQNAAARRDVGIATGCMLLFRAIGGAFGAAIAAAMLLAHGFGVAFGVCAAVAVVAVFIAVVMRDAVLRAA
jgi:MFS family permease